ncbi:hypothetical protein BDW22DRAFT_1351455 [Trametopsis cervina]|nr:hypothetical protein BDW22DRAFT_1351455 [Trametopsis cervina]
MASFIHGTDHDCVQVIVTQPSSPEAQQLEFPLKYRPPLTDTSSYSSDEFGIPAITHTRTLSPITPGSSLMNLPSPPSRFEALLADTQLPTPGPAHFFARRALWLTPVPHPPSSTPHPYKKINPNLQALLEGPVERLCEDANWKGGIGKICERILNRELITYRMPLRHLTKMLQANWMVDNVWPKGQLVPSSDEEKADREECTVA